MAIDTIFYFANNQAEYEAAEIASRTISFVPRESGRGNIYKNNVRYGGIDVEFDAEAVKTIFKNWQNDPNSTDKPEAYTLPTASTTIKGGIKIGKALSMNGETMNVDFSGIQASDISGLQALIETIVRGMGLSGSSARFRIQNGVLQVSYDNGTTWSNLGNIGGGSDPVNYAITQFTTSGNSIRLVQTNGFSGSVDISSVVTNIINTLYPGGPQGGGDEVEVTGYLNSGTHIATIKVNNDITELYAPIADPQTPVVTGDTVSVSPNTQYNSTNGNLIGTITVNNVSKQLYAPKGSDNNGASTLDDLEDVNTTGKNLHDVLKYNGSKWVPGTIDTDVVFNATLNGTGIDFHKGSTQNDLITSVDLSSIIENATDVRVNALLEEEGNIPIATIAIDNGQPTTIYAPSGGSGNEIHIDNPPYDDQWIRDALTNFEGDIDETKLTIRGKLDDTDAAIKQRFKNAFTTYKSLLDYYENSGDTTVSQYTFGQDDMETWLSQKGLIIKNGNQITVGWSDLTQSYNNISAEVTRIANIVDAAGGTINYEILAADLYAYIDDNYATSGLSSTWGKFAELSGDDILTLKWMSSGVKTYASNSETYAELMSAARDYANDGKTKLQEAYAGVNTLVTRDQNNNFVATASLTALVNDSLSGLLVKNSSNQAVAGLFSDVEGTKAIVETTCVKQENGVVQSGVGIKADQIVLDGSTQFTTLIGNKLIDNEAFINSLFTNRAFIGDFKSKDTGIYCHIDAGSTYGALDIEDSNNKYVNVSANPTNGGWVNLYGNTNVETSLKSNEYDMHILRSGNIPAYLVHIIGDNAGYGKQLLQNTDGNCFIWLNSEGDGCVHTLNPDTYAEVKPGWVYVYNINTKAWAKMVPGEVTESSDIRIKNVIEDKHISAEQIADAPAFTYNVIGDTSNKVFVGTSAQYWQDVLPETVSEENEYLGLDYSKVATVSVINLAKEVVTLKQEKAALIERVEALEARLQLIENQLNAQ